MTKLESLAKDCIENHTHRLVDKPTKQDIYLREESIFIQGYRQSEKRIAELEKENAEIRAIAENQQSSNMSRYFEIKKLKEFLATGSMWNKHLNSQNKALEEERDKYRNMTFDQREQLTQAKEIIKKLKALYFSPVVTKDDVKRQDEILAEVEQFIKE